MRHRMRTAMVVLSAALLAGLVGASSAAAQSANSQEGIGVQIVGGPLFANFADAQGFSSSNKTGYLVGVALGGNRGGVVGVEADVLYGQKGATIAGAGDFDQHIVHVPVMLKVNAGSGNANGLSFFGLGGGFFDWQFNSKLAGVDISKNTDGYEVGYVLGGGVEVLRFSVQGRYIRGLREINKTFNVGSSTDVKSQAFAVLFAFRLN